MNIILSKDKEFYMKMFTLAIPIIIQNFISSSLNLVDNMMIGRLGGTAIASVGIPNQYFFLFVLILFGVNSGTGIFVSQFWGKEDTKNIKRVLGISLVSGVGIALIFTLVAFLFPKFIIGLFVKDNLVIERGSDYLGIVIISYVITAISFSYSFASRSIGRAKLPMVASIAALSTNTFLNYTLIFGNFGFTALGVKGAAIATVISRIVELSIIIIYIYKKDNVLNAKFSELSDLSIDFVKKFFKTTTPVIINEGFWALGMSMYMIAYGKISTEAVTAVYISNTIQSLFFVVGIGVGNSCGVMIGNKIGENNFEKAYEYALRFSVISVVTGIVIGSLIALFSPLILKLYNVTEVVHDDAIKILIVMGIFMLFKMFNMTHIVGIFRSGGDTKYAMMLEIGSVWGIGVPLAFIGSMVFNLPIYIVVALVHIDEIVKSTFGIKRIFSKKWIKNIVNDI